MCSPQQPPREQVLAGLAGIDPAALDDATLMEVVKELAVFADQVQGHLARLAAKLETAGSAVQAGHGSAAAFLRAACGRAPARASELVITGYGLAALPATSKALDSGQISFDHAVAVAQTAAQISDPQSAGHAEQILLDAAAGGVTCTQLRHLGEEIAYRADPDAADERERKRWERRHLSFGLTLDHTGTLTGACGDTLSYETVRTAAEAFAPPGGALDTRTAAQRRLDGLVAACRTALDTATAPIRHGAVPHITVLVHDHTLAQAASVTALTSGHYAHATPGTSDTPGTADTAASRGTFGIPATAATRATTVSPANGSAPQDASTSAGAVSARGAPPARTGHGAMLTARQVLTLCCSAEITAIRWADGLPLDVGRASRTEPPALRKALYARDRTCRWPGCDAPAQWCTAHHIGGWANGATTCLAGMVLLCHHHHSYFIHQLGWTITGDPNQILRFHHPTNGLTLQSPLPGKPRAP
ncbi:MAG: DUF222 domain-containing protein [Micromonosporaceae bacterium]